MVGKAGLDENRSCSNLTAIAIVDSMVHKL